MSERTFEEISKLIDEYKNTGDMGRKSLQRKHKDIDFEKLTTEKEGAERIRIFEGVGVDMVSIDGNGLVHIKTSDTEEQCALGDIVAYSFNEVSDTRVSVEIHAFDNIHTVIFEATSEDSQASVKLYELLLERNPDGNLGVHGIGTGNPEEEVTTTTSLAKFCPNCGKGTEGMKFCPECGAALNLEQKAAAVSKNEVALSCVNVALGLARMLSDVGFKEYNGVGGFKLQIAGNNIHYKAMFIKDDFTFTDISEVNYKEHNAFRFSVSIVTANPQTALVPHEIIFKEETTAVELYELLLGRSPNISQVQAAPPQAAPPQSNSSQGNNEVCCPKCGSTSLSGSKKGFSAGKAAAGLLIPGGVLWGFHGSKKIQVTCLNCGKQFMAGKG